VVTDLSDCGKKKIFTPKILKKRNRMKGGGGQFKELRGRKEERSLKEITLTGWRETRKGKGGGNHPD